MCIGGTAVLLQSCTGGNYLAKTTVAGSRLALPKAEFDKAEKGTTTKRSYVIVKAEQLNFPICVYRIDDATYSAVLMECTHKGCELQPHGDFLVCPCHGSEFSKNGVVQNPPAEFNLKNFPITLDHETIYIQL